MYIIIASYSCKIVDKWLLIIIIQPEFAGPQ